MHVWYVDAGIEDTPEPVYTHCLVFDFAGVRTSGVIGVGSSAGTQGGWAMLGPHCHLRTITQPAVACLKHRKTAGWRVRGSGRLADIAGGRHI